MYIYVWFDAVGWSDKPPTPEDELSIENGDLFVLEVRGDDVPPRIVNSYEDLPRCDIIMTDDFHECHAII